DNVAKIRLIFLETNDNKKIHGIKLSIRGCFFKIPNFKIIKPTIIKPIKPSDYCHSIDLMNKRHMKYLLHRISGNLNLPEIYNSNKKSINQSSSSFFILE